MSGSSPTVSVVIPTRNRVEKCIRAVQSALAQTFEPLEVLVCDDGSSDHTRDAIEGLARDDERIRLFSANAASGSPAQPRNTGIFHARGEWIALLDDDDLWLPEKLEFQLEVADSSATIVCSNARRSSQGLYFAQTRDMVFSREELVHENPVIISSALISRKRLIASGGFSSWRPLAGCADYDLWLRLVRPGDTIVRLATPLVDYDDSDRERLSARRAHMATAEAIAFAHALLKSKPRIPLLRPTANRVFMAGVAVASSGGSKTPSA